MGGGCSRSTKGFLSLGRWSGAACLRRQTLRTAVVEAAGSSCATDPSPADVVAVVEAVLLPAELESLREHAAEAARASEATDSTRLLWPWPRFEVSFGFMSMWALARLFSFVLCLIERPRASI